MIRLYQLRNCPGCARARRALDALGRPYETVEVPRTRADRHEVARVSGQRLVPMLVDGDRVVDDSGAIARYLDATYGGVGRGADGEVPAGAACALPRAA